MSHLEYPKSIDELQLLEVRVQSRNVKYIDHGALCFELGCWRVMTTRIAEAGSIERPAAWCVCVPSSPVYWFYQRRDGTTSWNGVRRVMQGGDGIWHWLRTGERKTPFRPLFTPLSNPGRSPVCAKDYDRRVVCTRIPQGMDSHRMLRTGKLWMCLTGRIDSKPSASLS